MSYKYNIKLQRAIHTLTKISQPENSITRNSIPIRYYVMCKKVRYAYLLSCTGTKVSHQRDLIYTRLYTHIHFDFEYFILFLKAQVLAVKIGLTST